MSKSAVPPWELVRRNLAEAGAPASAIESIRRATVPVRHEARASAALVAAEEWAIATGAKSPKAVAVLALLQECWGIGGAGGLGGAGRGTARHPAFRGLGTGRALARDGGAWTAAIALAVELAAGGWVELGATSAGGVAVSMERGGGGSAVPTPETTAWWRVVAARGAAAVAGAEVGGGDLPCQVYWGGELADWVALLRRLDVRG